MRSVVNPEKLGHLGRMLGRPVHCRANEFALATVVRGCVVEYLIISSRICAAGSAFANLVQARGMSCDCRQPAQARLYSGGVHRLEVSTVRQRLDFDVLDATPELQSQEAVDRGAPIISGGWAV